MIKDAASKAKSESPEEIVKFSGSPAIYEKIVRAIAGGCVRLVKVTKADTIKTLKIIPTRLPPKRKCSASDEMITSA